MAPRILIIEDNPENLKLMTYLLEAFGHQTVAAMTGDDGLALLGREALELVICDIQLPGISGYEVARRIKADAAHKHLPLLGVTAFAMAGDREKVLAAGFDGYLPKPINPETFVAQVEAWLPVAPERAAQAVVCQVSEEPLPGNQAIRATILMVDNSFDNIHVVRATLEPLGLRLIGAQGVEEGLECAHRTRPNLILSDVFIAGESGYDFLQHVKQDPELRTIPFVFISSSLWAEKDLAHAIQLGADDFIRRPIEPQSLIEKIELHLAQRR